jgi:GNAT superfamily N-acetyltransferase
VTANELRPSTYDHPDAQLLISEVQSEYVRRYGSQDEAPIDPRQFDAPNGLFVLAYVEDEPAAMGGWRRLHPSDPVLAWAGSAVEIKRMFVRPAFRGRGLARAILGRLEQTSAQNGAQWAVLETGSLQPEAVALYESAGYVTVEPFGHYADAALSLHLGKQLRPR